MSMPAEYDASWESMESHSIPGWLKNSPLGVYFHWGPYSVTAIGDGWYPRNMYREGTDTYDYHCEQFGEPESFGYKDFVPLFDGAEFDAEEIVGLCEEAGADFVGLAAIHHDGFAMWDSDVTRWNAADKGPKQDIAGELASAVRDQGMKFFMAFHHAFTWWYYPREEGYDTMDPAYSDLYGAPHSQEDRYPSASETPPDSYFETWRDLTIEAIDNYRPDLIWFDFAWGNEAFVEHDTYRRDVVSHYYSAAEEWGTDVDICHKEDLPVGVGVQDYERTRKEEISNLRWVTDTSVDRESWVANPDPDYKSTGTLVRGLVDRVSKNGTTLLNLCPRPSGEIPGEQKRRLVELGDWIDANRQAVDGSRPGWRFGEGPTEVTSDEFEEASRIEFTGADKRFSRSVTGDCVYVMLMEWPADGETTIETPVQKGLSNHVDDWVQKDYDIKLVGPERDLQWQLTDAGLNVTLGETPPDLQSHVYTIRIG